jgi:hypothetical protein
METQTLKNGFAAVPAIAMGFVGDAFNVVSAVGTFKASTEEGDHPIVAGVKGATDFIAGEMFYGAMGGSIASSLGVGLIASGVAVGANMVAQHMENTGQALGKGSENLKGIGSGHFEMTQAGYTMRQRSLNAIRSNGANINSAFGNEARNYWLGL